MLRVGLLESLARLARQMQATAADRARAAADLKREALAADASDAYVVGVLHALRDMHDIRPELDQSVRTWLARRPTPVSDILRHENQRQAGNQVSVGNAVTSLRLLAALDWPTFVEDLSATEAVLRAEPSGNHGRQTFATRDACRGAVERLSRGSGVAEAAVAARAVALAAARPDDPHARVAAHFLIGDGEPELARAMKYRARGMDGPRRWMRAHPDLTYFGLLGLLTAGLTAAAVAATGTWLAALVAVPAAAEVAVAMLNFLLGRVMPATKLPRMDFRAGVPEEFATFVVIPGMITKPQGARGLLERLELHHLANPDPNLTFALLTDFADAPTETTPDDAACLAAAMDGVAALNAKHPREGTPRFFLLHRRRLYNPAEGCWMGWERKRGKLHEFNRLIRGDGATTYAHRSPGTPPRTRFVLTLDSDTVLPRDAARAMIGTLAHPLNRARLSADGRRVVAGYGILQPRVSFLYASGSRSMFARTFAYSAGIDPYSTAVSDTYMDLFGRASFTGKGLYDVDAFEATAGKAFPENHILSHDLIESNYARCGLVSNVEVFDDFPARYPAYSRREHRWARGDWQLLPWLGPTVPSGEDEGGRMKDESRQKTDSGSDSSFILHPSSFEKNPLPALERWKAIDNLRRTLTPAALVVTLLLGWTVLPGGPWAWTLLVLVTLAASLLLHAFGSLLSVPAVGVPQAWVNSRAGFASTLGQALLACTFLAHQAVNLLDAVGRTLARLFVTRRRLLEWETAAATEARLGDGLGTYARGMAGGLLLAMAAAGLVAWAAPGSLGAAAVFLVPWLVAPLVAWTVSRPTPVRRVELSAAERAQARQLASKTWGFFEAFVGDVDHWLPPDNYQEGPVEAVAHRT
ncbi:MAG: glycosyltransferase family 2 protein, partial [Gemmataceae bacterium]